MMSSKTEYVDEGCKKQTSAEMKVIDLLNENLVIEKSDERRANCEIRHPHSPECMYTVKVSHI